MLSASFLGRGACRSRVLRQIAGPGPRLRAIATAEAIGYQAVEASNGKLRIKGLGGRDAVEFPALWCRDNDRSHDSRGPTGQKLHCVLSLGPAERYHVQHAYCATDTPFGPSVVAKVAIGSDTMPAAASPVTTDAILPVSVLNEAMERSSETEGIVDAIEARKPPVPQRPRRTMGEALAEMGEGAEGWQPLVPDLANMNPEPVLWTAADWPAAPSPPSTGPASDGTLVDKGGLPQWSWDEVVSDAAALRDWLGCVRKFGFGLLRGLPAGKDGAVCDAAELFGHVRSTTTYGRWFSVKLEAGAWHLASTGAFLAPHCDNPYRGQGIPTLQLLHFTHNRAIGGETTLVDGWAVAESMRRDDPEGFALLTQFEVPYAFSCGAGVTGDLDHRPSDTSSPTGMGSSGLLRDAGDDMRARTPVVLTDTAGRVFSTRFNSRCLEAFDMPAAVMDRYYAAYTEYARRMNSDEYLIKFAMQPGDMYVVRNTRVFHGRAAFEVPEEPSGTTDPVRELHGCYADEDALESTHRVLVRGLDKQFHQRRWQQSDA